MTEVPVGGGVVAGVAVSGAPVAVRAVAAGHEPFEAVVAAHGATVLRVCRAVVGPDAADDAWSETFLAALRAYPALPAGSDVRAWLVTIAHRKAVDQHRAAARRPAPTAELPERAGGELLGDWRADLWEAVGELPAKQRRCVAYHHLGGLPYAEVAALVGGSEAAARRAAADGVRALRRAWGDGGDSGDRNDRVHGDQRSEREEQR
ncbi:RNA polymerase sigma factor [Kineococcus rubinsiae]|uniref:RNA polymerase sigma factor n=1 Tax=Kineococcus rubinsiae TaxID=2609562 RepID=UPI0014304A21|nr:RNA polymerase sigma factor [Kineococcus rubinsiae]NIZ89447.1 RNA polymerase sigma factor [Kineococcus rubinsiae]